MNGRTLLARALAAGILLVSILSITPDLRGQSPEKRPLTHRDYDIWNTASGMTLSKDGRWLAYSLLPADGDGVVIVRNLQTGAETRIPRGKSAAPETPPTAPTAQKQLPTPPTGGSPTFSPDVKRLYFPLLPTRIEMDKAKAAKTKPEEMPKPVLAVLDLATGKIVDRIPKVKSFTIGGTGAGFMIYQVLPKEAPQPPATPVTKTGKKTTTPMPTKQSTPATPRPVFGTDLVIRDLASGKEHTVANVGEHSLTKDHRTLVYTVNSPKPEENGVFALNPASPKTSLSVLRFRGGKYNRLTWDEKQSKLAFFAAEPPAVPTEPNIAPPPRLVPGQVATPPVSPKSRVFVWDRPARARVAANDPAASALGLGESLQLPAIEVLAPDSAGLRKGWSIVDRGGLSFSADGSKLFVSTAPSIAPAPRPATPTPTSPTDDRVVLDIWHWKDGYIQPMQKVRADIERNKSYRGVVLLDGERGFRQLADETLDVSPPPAGDWALSGDDRPYLHLTGYGATLRDVSLLNIRTGERRSLMKASGSFVSLAPDGKHAVTFDNTDWIAYSLPDGRKTNLTAGLNVKFFNEEWDTPSEPPAYGMQGWTKEFDAVLVRDRYDVWKLPVNGGKPVNLTRIGRENGIEFRILPQPRDDEDEADDRKGVDLSKPLLLAAENVRTRDTGFYRLEPGQPPKPLLMEPRKFGAPVKAKNADVYLVTASTFHDSPNYYTTDGSFKKLRQVTDINPRTKEFVWGKAELIRYRSADGVPLTGMLVKPENFDPKKKYPLMVYIYERLSENLHTFRLPAAGTSINPTYYASNGYLVLMPDIAYTVGSPGQSALKCVLPAIQEVVDQGIVNENAIGIQGHSWGGYQISYMVTQTNRFKAAVAGAPVSNMISAYGGIRWGSGLPREFQYERTQSRIGATLWQAPMKFIENSPIFMADRVKTPLLILHNDQDDAVPWYQGIEYYLALRRLEREVYLLNYNGELHGLRKKANQRDYTLRMQQFFDHHLKGSPAPEWMAKGVPYLDREKEKQQWTGQFAPAKAPKADDPLAGLGGQWSLTLPSGEAGWLDVREVNGKLAADLLWAVGSARPIPEPKIEAKALTFTRSIRRPLAPKEEKAVSYRITMRAEGDVLRCEMKPETGKPVTFTGKRQPPLPPKPDLSRVKFGEPIALFNGKDMAGWRVTDAKKLNGWSASDGLLKNDTPKKDFSSYGDHANLRTEAEFSDFQLHVEFRLPKDDGGNSGIYLRGLYEVQVTHRDSKMQGISGPGAVFGRIAPAKNAGKPAGEWETYDITLVDRHITVVHNGQTVIDNQPVAGCTGGALLSDVTKPGPIYLQGDHTSVEYRKLQLRPRLP